MITWMDILGEGLEPGEIERFLEGRSAGEAEIAWLQSTFLAPISDNEAAYGNILGVDAREWILPNYPLPPSFLDLLRCENGADFGSAPRNIQCFPISELRGMMLSYCVPHWWPLAVTFAFNDGGDFYAFDMRQPPDANGEFPICMCYAGDSGWEPDEAWKIADSLEECFRDPRDPGDLR